MPRPPRPARSSTQGHQPITFYKSGSFAYQPHSNLGLRISHERKFICSFGGATHFQNPHPERRSLSAQRSLHIQTLMCCSRLAGAVSVTVWHGSLLLDGLSNSLQLPCPSGFCSLQQATTTGMHVESSLSATTAANLEQTSASSLAL